MRPDRTKQRPLTSAGRWNVDPSWSPDGSRIVFSSERNGRVNLYTLDVRTDAERRLTSGPNDDRSPSWSSDGRRIAFVAQRLDSNVTDIWVVNANFGLHPVTHDSDNNLDPIWSPDGATILFVKDEFYGHDSDIWTISASGWPETPIPTPTPFRRQFWTEAEYLAAVRAVGGEVAHDFGSNSW